MKLLPLLAAAAALLLAGCASTVEECDPTTGDVSLIKKFNCKYSGTYDKRVDMKEQTLAHEKELNTEFKAALAAIEKEKSLVNADLRTQQASQKALNQSMNNLLVQARAKSKNHSDIQARINTIEKQLKESQNSPEQSTMEKQLELENLKNQVMDLQTDLGLQ